MDVLNGFNWYGFFFFLAIFFSPVIMGIAALIMERPRKVRRIQFIWPRPRKHLRKGVSHDKG